MKCPGCQSTIDSELHSCPHCGAELTDVTVDGSGPSETTRRSLPSWAVFVGVAAAVIAIGLGAWAFTGSSSPQGSLMSDVPANVGFYAEFDVAELTSDRARAVAEAFGPVIEDRSGEPFDLDTVIADAMAELESELGNVDLSFSADIAPCASGRVAIGSLPPTENIDERAIVIVSGRDADALDAFLAKLSTLEGVTQNEGATFGEVSFMSLTHDDETFLVARRGNDLLVATDRGAAEDLALATEGNSLADVAAVADQLAELDDRAAVTFAVDTTAISEQIQQFGGEGLALDDMSTGWAVGSVAITDDGLRVQGISQTGPSGPASFDPEVVRAVPADTVAFFRAGSLIRQLETLASSEFAGPMLGSFEDEIGISATDILGIFSRDAAIAVWPSTQPELPVNAALVGSADANQSALIDRIAALAPFLGLESHPIDGGYVFSGVAALGTRENLTLLTTDRDLIGSAPEQSFEASGLHDAATSLVDGDLVMAVDLPAVIDLVDGLVAMEDPEAAETLRCLPFGILAAGVTANDTVTHTQMVLEITPRC